MRICSLLIAASERHWFAQSKSLEAAGRFWGALPTHDANNGER
jgi:hypothetical protein